MAMRDGDPRLPKSGRGLPTSPLAALIVVGLAIGLFAYNFGNQPSNSEKYGTITESEAEDGVTPSLPPDGNAGPSDSTGSSLDSANSASSLP
jgi:hypothetical protein